MTRSGGTSPQRAGAIRTFLIADMRGWTKFTNELGDEAASRLAGKFAQVVGEAVEAHDGVLLELRGDEAMCVFASARAALRCAVELQDAFRDETRLEPHLPLNVGIGLDAGEAVPVGDGYRGAALNLAARLCSAASAGEVVATDGLIHLAGPLDGLAYAELDAKQVKGFAEPVAAWLVAAELPHEHPDADAGWDGDDGRGLPAELDPIVPLVGRQVDLRWLAWYWRRTRHGHGGVVALSGQPGMGRTRLAAELAAVALADGATVRYVRAGDDLDPGNGPGLIVIDDVDDAPPARARALLATLTPGNEQRLVILTHRTPVPARLDRQIGRLIPAERRRELGPIDHEAVGQIAQLYLDRPAHDVPVQLLLEESDGIPAAVHRVASQWARAAAARRLGESARRTSRERRDLRAAEADLIGDVASLEVARERSRLFVEVDQGVTDPAELSVTVCPYKGLAAFEATDAAYYFGRERLIAELIARMVGSSFIGLIGASGSGKSSALQAGLLPELRNGVLPGSDQWIQVLMRPGDHPIQELQLALHRDLAHRPSRDADVADSLDAALAQMRPAQRLLLVVDQFEEIFTAAVDDAERAAFITHITEPRAGMKVLVAVRADQYERCSAYPRLARLLGADQVLVGPLMADEIAAIIRHPAERVGLSVEPELVNALVTDVGAEPGGLPLLSTSLLELWEIRDGRRLTLAAYQGTGGVSGAVARLAEAAYGQLDSTQQLVARALFLRLAGEGGHASVRRRARTEELDADDPDVAAVVAALTAARLLTASDGYVEVAHEALLREWPRLRAWLDEDGAGRQLRLHLFAAARAWDEGGREHGDLYRGARLGAVLDWSAEHLAELNATERTFIAESRAASARETERQQRTNRTLRGLLAGAAVFLVLAIGAGAFAGVQAERADDERRNALAEADRAEREAQRAEEQETLARSRELAQSAIAVLEQDPELSLQLAVEALEIAKELPPEAVTALHRAVQASRAVLSLDVPFEEGEQRPFSVGVQLSADGSRLFVARNSRSIDIYDVASKRLVETLGTPQPDTGAQLLSVALSEDDERVAIVDEEAVIHIWNLDDGSEQQIAAPGFGVSSRPTFSPDGRLIAVPTHATDDGDPGRMFVTIWDLQTEQEVLRLDEDELFDLGLSDVQVLFHPDRRRVLLAACNCLPDGGLRWLDLETGAVSEPFVKDVPINAVAVSPDGAMIATGDAERKVILWDSETGRQLRTFRGHRDVILSVSFSRDGQRIASTSGDDTTRIWDTNSGGDPSGVELLRLTGQSGGSFHASFSADGSHLATGGTEMTVRVWDISRERAAEVTSLDRGWARIISLQAAGDYAAALGRTCSAGFCFAEATLLNLRTGETQLLPDVSSVGIGLSPDGAAIVAQVGESQDEPATRFGPVRRYSTGTLATQDTLDELCPFSFTGPEGELACGEPPGVPWDEQVVRIAFSADGNRMALAGNSPAVSLWDTPSGRLLGVLRMDWLAPDRYPNLGLALNADGTLLALSTVGPADAEVFVLRTAAIVGADRSRLEGLDAQLRAFDAMRQDAQVPGLDGFWAIARDGIRAQLAAMIGLVHQLEVEGWALEFSPDSAALAVASPGGSRVIDLDSGDVRYELLPGWGLDLSADGSRLITMDSDGAARLWDFASGRELQVIPAVSEGVGDIEGAVQFAEDDRHIVVADAGIVKVLTVDVDELVTIARSRITRELTDEECRKYLHQDTCGS